MPLSQILENDKFTSSQKCAKGFHPHGVYEVLTYILCSWWERNSNGRYIGYKQSWCEYSEISREFMLSKKNPIGLFGDLLIDSFLPYFIISEMSGILYSSSQAKDCQRYKYGVMQVRVGYSASLIKKLLSIFGGFDVLCKCGIVMACYCSHEF